MAESRWYVSIDGHQMESDYSLEAAKELVQKNLGKRVLVWTQGMTQWSMPEDIAEFRVPLPRPVPTPTPAPKPAPAPEPEPAKQEVKEKSRPFTTLAESEEVRRQAGILKGLLDFRFQELITGKLLPILYAIVVILIALAAVGYFFVGGGGMILAGIKMRTMFSIFAGLLIMVLTPVIAILYLALIRMWFELVIVIFRIKDDLSVLVERGKEKE